MKEVLIRFLLEETGQDLLEYTMLLAFVCLASAALFIDGGKNMAGIWSIGNSYISNGNVAAAS